VGVRVGRQQLLFSPDGIGTRFPSVVGCPFRTAPFVSCLVALETRADRLPGPPRPPVVDEFLAGVEGVHAGDIRGPVNVLLRVSVEPSCDRRTESPTQGATPAWSPARPPEELSGSGSYSVLRSSSSGGLHRPAHSEPVSQSVH